MLVTIGAFASVDQIQLGEGNYGRWRNAVDTTDMRLIDGMGMRVYHGWGNTTGFQLALTPWRGC